MSKPGPTWAWALGWCPGKTNNWSRTLSKVSLDNYHRPTSIKLYYTYHYIFHISVLGPGLSIASGLAASDNHESKMHHVISQGDEHDQLQLPLLNMYSVLQEKGKVAEQSPPC